MRRIANRHWHPRIPAGELPGTGCEENTQKVCRGAIGLFTRRRGQSAQHRQPIRGVPLPCEVWWWWCLTAQPPRQLPDLLGGRKSSIPRWRVALDARQQGRERVRVYTCCLVASFHRLQEDSPCSAEGVENRGSETLDLLRAQEKVRDLAQEPARVRVQRVRCSVGPQGAH